MNPVETYQVYSTIQLHFTSPSFNYGGRTIKTFTADAFDRRRDKYQFKKLGDLFANKQELEEFCYCWFLQKGGKAWVGEADPKNCSFYDDHRRFMGNPVYFFEKQIRSLADRYGIQELLTRKEGQLPKIIELCMVDKEYIHSFTLVNRIAKIWTMYDDFYADTPLKDLYMSTMLPIRKFESKIVLNSSADVKELREIFVSITKENRI